MAFALRKVGRATGRAGRLSVDDDRRRSLEHLVAAATRSAAELRTLGDPTHRDLIADLDRLAESVSAELGAPDS